MWVYTADLLAPSHDDNDDNDDGDVMGQARPTFIIEEPARRLLLLCYGRNDGKDEEGGRHSSRLVGLLIDKIEESDDCTNEQTMVRLRLTPHLILHPSQEVIEPF